MGASHEPTWLSLRDASERAGVSVSWLRKQYREHGLATRDTVGPRGLQKSVPLEEVVARAAVFTASRVPPDGDGPAPEAPTKPGPATPAVASVALADVLLAVETLARAQHDTSLLDRLIAAEARAAQAEAESAYLMLRLEDAYSEIQDLRDRVTDS